MVYSIKAAKKENKNGNRARKLQRKWSVAGIRVYFEWNFPAKVGKTAAGLLMRRHFSNFWRDSQPTCATGSYRIYFISWRLQCQPSFSHLLYVFGKHERVKLTNKYLQVSLPCSSSLGLQASGDNGDLVSFCVWACHFFHIVSRTAAQALLEHQEYQVLFYFHTDTIKFYSCRVKSAHFGGEYPLFTVLS